MNLGFYQDQTGDEWGNNLRNFISRIWRSISGFALVWLIIYYIFNIWLPVKWDESLQETNKMTYFVSLDECLIIVSIVVATNYFY
jgi:hypothetical protein